MLTGIFLAGCTVFWIAYLYYGRKLAAWTGEEPARPTPAHELNDNVDYVPTHTPVLFGHHFSSIAGAGPIIGPILAGLAFGWLPALLWILIGAVFVGGVHDYAALMASLRHGGRSIGDICRGYFSPFIYKSFLAFVWFTLVYVLVVFLDMTAATFTGSGAVATASLLYIAIALLFGVLTVKCRMPFKTASVIFVPLVFAAVYAGIRLPLEAKLLPAVVNGEVKNTWLVLLMAYCFIASVTPVWVLLQPRDYLSSFLLVACLVGGGAGLVLAGIGGHAEMSYPAFIGWHDAKLGLLFPALFITVACGAVSGFHSIVASGTTAKQLNREADARPVAYGGMLVEGVLAIIALGTLIVLSKTAAAGKSPIQVFSTGLAEFLHGFGISREVGVSFATLAISTFLLTTLDTATRLARFIFEEFFGLRGRSMRHWSTLATLAATAPIVFMRVPNPGAGGGYLPAWQVVWPAFGATNQLLAALALLVVFVWQVRRGRPAAFVFIPMLFMLATTAVALAQLIHRHLFQAHGQRLMGGLCLVLFILALLVVAETARNWRQIRQPTAAEGA